MFVTMTTAAEEKKHELEDNERRVACTKSLACCVVLFAVPLEWRIFIYVSSDKVAARLPPTPRYRD